MARRPETLQPAAISGDSVGFDPILAERQQLGQERIIACSQGLNVAAQIFHGTGDIEGALAAAERIRDLIWSSATDTRRLRQEVAGLVPTGTDTEH